MDTANAAAIVEAIDSINANLERVMASFAHLKGLLSPAVEVETFDPRDPANRNADGKLSERGIEICYRLFDAGKTRYAVGAEMKMSFSASKHRFEAWQKAGGVNRIKTPLT